MSPGFSYDGRGNLTNDGTNSFTYTSENLLKTGPASATLGYDPLGRLYQTIGGGVTTRLEYDGADLIAEYDGSNAVQRRYVHGPGVDEPIVWYEGSAINNTTRRFLMADERGSIVSITDSAGATININAYDEYGIPAPTNIGRFGYTGQTWLPEVRMWYYKARIYSPTLGRFMQTDPIGYDDGMNWYNYVASDPVNFADPTGRECAVFYNNSVLYYDKNNDGRRGPGEPPIPGSETSQRVQICASDIGLQMYGRGGGGLFKPLPPVKTQIENCSKLGLGSKLDKAIEQAQQATRHTGHEYGFAVGVAPDGRVWISRMVTSGSKTSISAADRRDAYGYIKTVKGISDVTILLFVHIHPTGSRMTLSEADNKSIQVDRNLGASSLNVMAVHPDGTRMCTGF